MHFLKIESGTDTYYIDSDRIPEWYAAAVKYHYVEPKNDLDDSCGSGNISPQTYNRLTSMILYHTRDVAGLTSLLSTSVAETDACLDSNELFDWEYDVCAEKILNFYPDRYSIHKLIVNGATRIAIKNNQWDTCFLVNPAASFLIGHFDQYYIQYEDHYLEFGTEKISLKSGLCPLAGKEEEWLNKYYRKNDNSTSDDKLGTLNRSYRLYLEEHISHADKYYENPLEVPFVQSVWQFVLHLLNSTLKTGQSFAGSQSRLIINEIDSIFSDFCNDKYVTAFRIKAYREMLKPKDDQCIDVFLNYDSFSFLAKDIFLNEDTYSKQPFTIQVDITRINHYFIVETSGESYLKDLNVSDWHDISVYDSTQIYAS